MKINLRFFILCESVYWYWSDYCAVPRIGEQIEEYGNIYKVIEVKYTKECINIIVERL